MLSYCHTLSLHDALPNVRRTPGWPGTAGGPAISMCHCPRRTSRAGDHWGATSSQIASTCREGPTNVETVCRWRRAGSTNSPMRSEEHTSELQSLMRISYAVVCWKKQKQNEDNETN